MPNAEIIFFIIFQKNKKEMKELKSQEIILKPSLLRVIILLICCGL